MGAPIIASDAIDLTAGQTNIFNAVNLQPDASRPMLIRELVWTIRSARFNTSPAPVLNQPVEFGGFFVATLKVGAYEIAPQPVPLWCFCPRHHYFPEALQFGEVPAANANAPMLYVNTYRWVLPKPMYIAPGDSIQASVQRLTDYDAFFATVAASTFNVRLTLRGEYLDATRLTSVVPFVSAFSPEAGRMHSNDRELKNTLSKEIQIQRFVGRIRYHTGGDPGAPPSIGPEALDSTGGRRTLAVLPLLQPFRVSIRDGNAYSVTKQMMAFNNIFPWATRSWTFNKELAPNANYQIALDIAPLANWQPQIAFIGHREENV